MLFLGATVLHSVMFGNLKDSYMKTNQKMEWNNIFSPKRLVTDTNTAKTDGRSEYQRDFDRIIFSSGFRRMQNKTQVFPLPGTTFVHNRLTHSLEVASVGRSLGRIVGNDIVRYFGKDMVRNPNKDLEADDVREFYKHELSNVIAAACLAHDIGNPPFGHSGENAISNYFIENQKEIGKYFQLNGSLDPCWNEFTHFEGNANGLRYLTYEHIGKIKGGLRLTTTTLASTLKYPCSFEGRDKRWDNKNDKSRKVVHRKKFNYFSTEKNIFEEICNETGMIKDIGACSATGSLVYKRHPFVYLTEAADDICYRLVDIEDAQKLKIIDPETVVSKLTTLIACLKVHDTEKVNKVLNLDPHIKIDYNDRISYLRAKCINALTILCAKAFILNAEEILNGTFNDDLLSFVIRNVDCPVLRNKDSMKGSYMSDEQAKKMLDSFPNLFYEYRQILPDNLKKREQSEYGVFEKIEFDRSPDKSLTFLIHKFGLKTNYALQKKNHICHDNSCDTCPPEPKQDVRDNSEDKRTIHEITNEDIYNDSKVVKIEVLGYEVLGELLNFFVPAVLARNPTPKEEKLRQIIPNQFRVKFETNNEKQIVFSLLDFISGMTDEYALRLYKELIGIEMVLHD